MFTDFEIEEIYSWAAKNKADLTYHKNEKEYQGGILLNDDYETIKIITDSINILINSAYLFEYAGFPLTIKGNIKGVEMDKEVNNVSELKTILNEKTA